MWPTDDRYQPCRHEFDDFAMILTIIIARKLSTHIPALSHLSACFEPNQRQERENF